MRLQVAPRLIDVELGQWHGAVDWPAHQDVVDRRRQRGEEPPEPVEVGRVEGSDAPVEPEAGTLHALRVSPRDDHLGSLFVCSPGRLEPDPRTPADHHERLTGELLVALHHATPARIAEAWTASDSTLTSRSMGAAI